MNLTKNLLNALAIVAVGGSFNFSLRAETSIDVTVKESYALSDKRTDARDTAPRMLVGHFREQNWGNLRGSMTFEIPEIPADTRIVAASLSLFARSAPWSPANPEGNPPFMIIKNGGQPVDSSVSPGNWNSYVSPGGDVSGAELSRLEPAEFNGGLAAENLFPSTEAFVTEIQKEIDAGDGTIHLIVYVPDIEAEEPKPLGKNFFRLDNHQNLPQTAPVLHLTYAIDNDRDVIDDEWEQMFFPGDLTNLRNGGDNDGDGLTDELEFVWKSDPTKADTDGDTLGDGQEVNELGTNPANADTDFDTIADNLELVANPYVTDPTKADSDDDGLDDNDEISLHGSDPGVADTDLDTYDDGLEVRLGAVPTDSESVPGQLVRGGLWSALHVVAETNFATIDEVDEFLADETRFVERTRGKYTAVNFNNNVSGDFFDSEQQFPLFPSPTNRRSNVLQVTGDIEVRTGGEITVAFNTNENGVLRIDGETLAVTEIERSISGRATFVATIDLSAGIHRVEFIHWAQTPTGVYLAAAYESGGVGTYSPHDFELMPAIGEPDCPFLITEIRHRTRPTVAATVVWNSLAGESYIVERSTDLITWLEIASNIPTQGESTSFRDENAEGISFYRVRRK